ncbi:MAG: MFS transporter [Hamadaea sp.]|nr:MFS transporter [Hamadaea sp.]NUT02891.1 MFS transporter [Hamadaea sp.]
MGAADLSRAPRSKRATRFWAATAIRPFRRLWLVLALSALGDWMGLLAGAAFASAQVTVPAAKGAAFGTVIAVQLLPAVILGAVAGVVADRFDRRITMVAMDVSRFLLMSSIPVVGLLVQRPGWVIGWAAVAMFAVQTAALIWTPAKEAAVPNLVPRNLLETANRLTLVTTYGVTPVLGALTFAAIARLPSWGPVTPVDLALLFDALTYLASAAVVYLGVPEISGRDGSPVPRSPGGLIAQFTEFGRFVTGSRLARGLIVGVLGAFAGAGVVIGTARFYAGSLGGGDATFGILFAALFVGFGIGVLAGPGIVDGLSRRRWFALSIVLAGFGVLALAVTPRPGAAAVAAVIVGAGAGMAFLSGITLVGSEVDDAIRGRVFAFLQTAVRVILLLSIAVSGALVGWGGTRHLDAGPLHLQFSAARIMLSVAGALGTVIGVVTLRHVDDRPGVPVVADVARSILRRPPASGRR